MQGNMTEETSGLIITWWVRTHLDTVKAFAAEVGVLHKAARLEERRERVHQRLLLLRKCIREHVRQTLTRYKPLNSTLPMQKNIS